MESTLKTLPIKIKGDGVWNSQLPYGAKSTLILHTLTPEYFIIHLSS